MSPLLLAACGKEPTQARVDAALAPLIPKDTTTILGIRFDLLKKTPVWGTLFPAGKPSVLDAFERRTGMNIREQLYEAIYCIGGEHRPILIRGKFTNGGVANAGLEPELKILGAQKSNYKGYSIIGQPNASVTFFNSSVAIAGRVPAIHSMVDARKEGGAIPTALLDLVNALPHTAHIYLVSTKPELPTGGIAGFQSLPLILNSLKAWIDPTGSVTLHAEATGQSPADARKLSEGLRGGIGLLRSLSKKGDEDMKQILEGIQLSEEGNFTRLSAPLPVSALANALKTLDERAIIGA